MAIPLYLAMTAAEFSSTAEQPEDLAWMACHFSPYGTGLTNVPDELPPKALLIVNDRTPIYGHDPKRILEILKESVVRLDCWGVLLDFQRPDYTEAKEIAAALQALPCPVAVSELYAKDLDCPVFLPPVPPQMTVKEYLLPWQHRPVWLEAALSSSVIAVTESGCTHTPLAQHENVPCPHTDPVLHCHYRIEVTDKAAHFTLRRTKEDTAALLEEAEKHGVICAVGLYQEFFR